MSAALKTIHVARRLLDIEEEDARDLYEQVTGKRSLRAMSLYEQGAVIEELKRRGFQPGGKSKSGLSGKYAPKMRALWIAAYNLGIVKNRDDHALIAFVARQTQIEHLNWVRRPEDADKAIEALKGWMRRESGCDFLYRTGRDDWAHEWQRTSPQVQVIFAQWAILSKAGATPDQTLYTYLGSRKYTAMTRHDTPVLIETMNTLGQLVRAVK